MYLDRNEEDDKEKAYSLLDQALIDRSIDDLLGYWAIKNWETIKPLVYGWRKQFNIPGSYHWFEYLYDEMKKREQKLQHS